MIRRVLLAIGFLICVTCAMRNWQFYFGIRLQFCDLLVVVFVFLSAFFLPVDRAWKKAGMAIQRFILGLWLVWIVGLLSIVVVWLRGGSELAWQQAFHQLISTFVNSFFVTFWVLFLVLLAPRWRKRLLMVYVFTVLASCFFEFFEVSLGAAGIDLIRLVFEPISYRAPLFETGGTMLYEWAGFFRANGFAGTDTQAVYVASAIPLIIIGYGVKQGWARLASVFVALLGLALTMSRTGALTLIGALMALAFFFWRRLLWVFPSVVVVVVGLSALAQFFGSEVAELAETRSHIDYTRLGMYAAAWDGFVDNPLGIGVGQYYVAGLESGELNWDLNLHNSWLQILVEQGIFGLLANGGFFLYLLIMLYKAGSPLSKAGFAAIIGLMAGALTNSVLDLFFVKFFVTLMFSLAMLDQAGDDGFRRW